MAISCKSWILLVLPITMHVIVPSSVLINAKMRDVVFGNVNGNGLATQQIVSGRCKMELTPIYFKSKMELTPSYFTTAMRG